ncbi:Pkinase-domain-containing protein [Amylocystis lapponica]|nr:Pkinase-domain-containing protein [Amylocystis lapponica]
MATSVLPTSKLNASISNRFHMTTHKRTDTAPVVSPEASSSRLASPSPSAPSEAQPKTFKRFRSSLEQSLRTATKSKAKAAPPPDENGILMPTDGKGKERASEDHAVQEKEKSRSRMLSKVSFRRPAGKDTGSPPVPPPVPTERKDAARADRDRDKGKARAAGHTSFETPSLRQASMSSPTLSSPYSSFALPTTSSSNVATGSPSRERSRRSEDRPSGTRDISGPSPLAPRRDSRSRGIASPSPSRETRGKPPPLNLSRSPERSPRSPVPLDTPTRRTREGARSPDLSPSPASRGLARRAAASATNLPLGSSPGSPTTARPISPSSPLRARSSSRTAGAGASASSSHLPLASSSSTASARRPSLDQHRPSLDSRRPSLDAHRPSLDGRPSSRSGTPTTPTTPVRARAVSPAQRNYSPSHYYQNRFLNTSTASLATVVNSEYRESIRSASSLLCREMLKPPSHLNKSSLLPREWEEVEVRMRALARLERIWGKSGSGMNSSTQLSTVGGLSSSGLSAGGEERERKLFCEAIRDGYVLCQFMNKLFPSTILRVDPREDGFTRTSNVTKFLAACSTLGLEFQELFNRDDLLESLPDGLARVAKTILALHKLSESAPSDRSRSPQSTVDQRSQGPYNLGASSRGAASTPNLSLAQMQRSASPVGPHSPTGRKRWSPPQPLPTLRSDSPGEDASGNSSDGKTVNNGNALNGSETPDNGDWDMDDVPMILTPPPRSPLRPRPSVDRSSLADSTRASIGDSTRASLADSVNPLSMRQSQASSMMTDSTAYSSLLEVQRNSSAGHNKFGTIRTVTTEATSLDQSETPSFSFTEGNAIAASLLEEQARKREVGLRGSRERRPSETALVDLTRVVEETEDSGSSSKGDRSREISRDHKLERPKVSPIKLGKGKWPDDFMDVFQEAPKTSALLDEEDLFGSLSSPPISASPPRKIAIVGAGKSDTNLESLSQFPRRPTHRARHSVDTPGLLPKDQFRRDSSPDSGLSSSPRIMIRRSSTKTGPQRNGVYIPRRDSSHSQDSESRVPFPKGEQSTPPSHERPFVAFQSGADGAAPDKVTHNDKPRQPRGRFQSEVDGSSSRRKPRPNSFESMVNLGVDLLSRDPNEGVLEDGKPPTQFVTVYRALNLNTGQMVAVKRISLEGLKEEEIAQLMREVDLVKSLSHPVLYAENGSLGQTLKAFGKLNERLVASYVVKILEGLHYLHQCDVVHCDLKAANILTTKNGNVKLSDFGVSLNLRAMEREMKDVAGTPNWMAPEVIELKGASTKSDIWSLGCTVIELLTGRPPYAEIANSMSVMFRIVEDAMPPLPEGCSDLLQDFLKQCFNKDPLKRPSAEMLCEHQWLRKFSPLNNLELRPQDSIPFLRRVSADFQKESVVRYLGKVDMPDPERSSPDQRARLDDIMSSYPPRTRLSNDAEPISPREHSFVKTTFGKPVICRVCLQSVKKSAVLCEQCSLIAHVKCAPNAPPTCDLRAQLLLYAQYAENGNSPNAYGNPTELLEAIRSYPASPTIPSTEDGFSPRSSLDASPSQSPPLGQVHPPTAFKVLTAFKRSRSSMNVNPDRPSASPVPSPPTNRTVVHKPSVLRRKTDVRERPPSISSSSTSPNSSSMRSAVTAAASLSSQREAARRSGVSTTGTDTRSGISAGDKSNARLSRMTSYSVVSSVATERDGGIPGDMPADSRHKPRDSKSGNCIVQ